MSAQTIEIAPASRKRPGARTQGVSLMSESTVEPGYCECGCGRYLGFWERTSRKYGWFKGEPKRFAVGHSQRSHPTIEGRFWGKVDRSAPNGCWEWTGNITAKGYGLFTVRPGPRTVSVHRFAYELVVGPIPEGLQLDHLCRNRKCVNPAHLEPVTNRENYMRSPRTGTETHCKRGHEFDSDNTYLRPNGSRVCRECRRLRDRERVV